MNTTCPYVSKKALVVTAAALLIGTVVVSQTTYAQDFTQSDNTITLTAIPPRVGDQEAILIAPGEKEQVQLRVRNNSTTSVTVRSVAQDFMLDLDGETPIPLLEETSTRWGLANWLVIAPTEQTIEPQTTVATSVLIEVPDDALPGGHYAMVTHEPSAGLENEQGGAASAISQKVGSLFYVIVDGIINEEAFIRDFTFPELTEIGPVDFSFAIDNQSDVHIRPQLSVEIYNLFNQKVETIPVESKNIFPLYNRSFDSTWTRVWGYGFYRAKLVMSYGSGGNIAMANTSFWLFPIKLVLTVLIILMVLLAMGIAIRRHILHKNDNKEEHIKDLEDQIQKMQQRNLEEHQE